MWDLAHKVGGGLKIEFPGDGNEAKGDGKGAGNEFEIARMVGEQLRLGKIMVVETLGNGANGKAKEEPDHDVADIVHTKIDACPTIEECPAEKAQSDGATAEDRREKSRDGNGVGGMRGEKTVGPAAITIHDVNSILEIWIMCGAPTGNKGFANGGSDLIAEENAEKDAANEEEHTRKIVFAENNIGDDEQKGDPNEHLGGIPRQTIEIKGRTSVEKESDDLIHDAKKTRRDAGQRGRSTRESALGVCVLHPVLRENGNNIIALSHRRCRGVRL